MEQHFRIHGMSCSSCKALIEESLNDFEPLLKARVDLEEKQLILETSTPIAIEQLQQQLPDKYQLEPFETVQVLPVDKGNPSKWRQLKPLFLIFLYLFSASIARHWSIWDTSGFMLDFMGLFYIVFSFFKFLDLKGFAQSFPMYDPLAKRLPAYAWGYPFLETVLGLCFLIRVQIETALWVTIALLGITTVGVFRVLLNKQQIRCACLGTVLQLPMTEATLIENLLMIGMAVGMLAGV